MSLNNLSDDFRIYRFTNDPDFWSAREPLLPSRLESSFHPLSQVRLQKVTVPAFAKMRLSSVLSASGYDASPLINEPKHPQGIYSAAESFLQTLARHPSWDLAYWTMAYPHEAAELAKIFSDHGVRFQTENQPVRFISGGRTGEQYIASLNSKFRSHNRKTAKQITELGYQLKADNLKIEDVLRLYHTRSHKMGESDYSVDPIFQRFFWNLRENMRNHNRWREVGCFDPHGRLCGMACGFWVAEKGFLFFQTAHDPNIPVERIGSFVFEKLITQALDEGAFYISLMGEQPYLQLWTKEISFLKKVTIYGDTIKGRYLATARSIAKAAKNMFLIAGVCITQACSGSPTPKKVTAAAKDSCLEISKSPMSLKWGHTGPMVVKLTASLGAPPSGSAPEGTLEQVWLRGHHPYSEQDFLVTRESKTYQFILTAPHQRITLAVDEVFQKKNPVHICDLKISAPSAPPNGIHFWNILPAHARQEWGDWQVPQIQLISTPQGFHHRYPDIWTKTGGYIQELKLTLPEGITANPSKPAKYRLVLSAYDPGFWGQVPYTRDSRWTVRMGDVVLHQQSFQDTPTGLIDRTLLATPSEVARKSMVLPVERRVVVPLTFARPISALGNQLSVACQTSTPRGCALAWAALVPEGKLAQLETWLEETYPVLNPISRSSLANLKWNSDTPDLNQIGHDSINKPRPHSLELLAGEPFVYCSSEKIVTKGFEAKRVFLRPAPRRFYWGKSFQSAILADTTSDPTPVSCLWGYASASGSIKFPSGPELPVTVHPSPNLPSELTVGAFFIEPEHLSYFPESADFRRAVLRNALLGLKDLGFTGVSISTPNTGAIAYLQELSSYFYQAEYFPEIHLYDFAKHNPKNLETAFGTLQKMFPADRFPRIILNIADEEPANSPELLRLIAGSKSIARRSGYINSTEAKTLLEKNSITPFCTENVPNCRHRYNLNFPRLSLPYSDATSVYLWNTFLSQGWPWDDFDSREKDYRFIKIADTKGEVIPSPDGLNVMQGIYDRRLLDYLRIHGCPVPAVSFPYDFASHLVRFPQLPSRDTLRNAVRSCPSKAPATKVN